MCTSIIGRCDCASCLKYPAPEPIHRVDFCKKKQEQLTGVAAGSLSLTEARFRHVPCPELSLHITADRTNCRFKNQDEEENLTPTIPGGDASDKLHATDRARQRKEPGKIAAIDHPREEFEKAAEHAPIRFTAINRDHAAMAKAALSMMAKTEANLLAQGATAAAGNANKMMDIDGPSRAAGENEMGAMHMMNKGKNMGDKDNVDKMDVESPSTVTAGTVAAGHAAGTSTNPVLLPETPTKDKEKQPIASTPPCTRGTATDPIPVPDTPKKPIYATKVKPITKPITSTSTSVSTNTGAGTVIHPARTPLSNGRTPLPTSRPRTHRVLQATAAAAATAAAERVASGQWTHEETVRLLLLRCKEVGFGEMGKYLPGRDVEACANRLEGLAVKHGYEAYI